MAEEGTISSIEVYLTVADASAALAFYEKAFSAKVTYREMAEDGARVQHAALSVFGGHFMLSDHFPEFISDVAPGAAEAMGCVTVQVNLSSPLEVDGAVARAVAAGAVVTAPPADTFWVMRYARVRDPFGHVWAFSAPLSLGS
ncbi:Glyoxalase family protein [Hyphomicrobium sulfonivorans]|uniref:Glyoxalase family protein n=1 Tax=Hyphomicrobium sulfonivorans TaxID=121290 RepID=A0A109BLM6_HYPSL|nr:VOC family protein [Hyphomicrobium sulfonivorans]KWT71059.1 Glyoxalase family protein [Hyphomicrobium sulfonivorans]